MKIAFVTPWPPQKTGIGDFALDLVSDLLEFNTLIHVFTDCEDPMMVNNVEFFNLNHCDLSQLKDYDLLIYQMGNNVYFHLYMLDLIKEYPGIVHLHDMVLHHLMGWITWMQGDLNGYLGLLSKWYGDKVSFLCHEMIKIGVMPWDSEIVIDIPLFNEFLQYADACIVNSEFAKKKVKAAFPNLSVYKITHVLKGMPIIRENDRDKTQELNIGVFGGIEPNKNVDIILESFSKLIHKYTAWRLHIVGEIAEKCRHVAELSEKLGIRERVVFYGRLSDENFKKRLSEMDLVISLRYPTMGETSGVVTRAMQMGIPVIVNNVGWYAELPDFVDKVPVQKMSENLLKKLIKYSNDIKDLSNKRGEFIKFSQEQLVVENIVKDFQKILLREYEKKLSCKLFQNSSDLLSELDISNDLLIEKFAEKVRLLF